MDDARFERLYAIHGTRVLTWCRFALGAPAEAEDAAAESFTRLLAKGDRVADEAVASWLYTVSRRICADIGRRSSRERAVAQIPEDAAVTEGPAPVWVDARLKDAVGTLSRLQQQVIFLRVIEDLPFVEVARLTRRNEAAVRMTYHRARRALASRMQGSNDELDY